MESKTGSTTVTDVPPLEPAARPATLKTRPPRRPGRWIASVVMVYLAYVLCHFLVTSDGMQWGVVREYLFFNRIIDGAWTTVYVTVLTMIIAIVLGVLIAVARMSSNPILRIPSGLYVWFFRGTPVLVQLIFWFNLASLTKTISVQLPFGITLYSGATNDLISPLAAALLGLGLNEAAYMAEIVRGGILGIDQGQGEAATALGMHRVLVLRRVVLPQAMRLIIPPSGNEFINLLKTTSLVSVITLSELLYSAQNIYEQTFQVIPLLVVTSLWYLAMVTVLSFLQRLLESRFGRGSSRNAPVSMRQRMRANLVSFRRTPAGHSS